MVRNATTEDQIWWDNNKPMSPEHFALLHEDMLAHARGKDLFVQDLIGGADAEYALPTAAPVSCWPWKAATGRHCLR